MEKISFATGSLGNNPIIEEALKDALAKVDVKLLLNYESSLGMVEFRKKIAEIYGRSINEDNIMVTSSSQQALAIVVSYLAKDKKKIFIQEPAYFGILRLARNDDIRTFETLDDIKRMEDSLSFSILYLTSNYATLAGSLTYQEKKKIAELSLKYDMMVIEDNPYDLIHFERKRPGTVFQIAAENTIYVGGFSKVIAPGLRVGYIISSQEIIRKLKSEKINQDIFTPTLGQQICLGILRDPKYLKRLRLYFQAKRDFTLKLLGRYFGKDARFSWKVPQGGIFITIQVAKNIPVEKMIRIAEEKYNLILESDRYNYVDGKSRNTIRINFVQNPVALLQEGISRLRKALEEAA